MDRIESSPVIADHEIIYKNDKPYIILDLKEYERLVHSSKNIKAANSKQKKEFIKINTLLHWVITITHYSSPHLYHTK